MSRVAEEWRPIEGFPKYDVSSLGRVRSHMIGPARILKPGAIPSGHRYVMLRRDGRQSIQYVHRLVCIAWHGPAPDGHQVAHLDGDCNNNTPANLVWATPKENTSHKYLHDTMGAKLSMSDVATISKRILLHETCAQIARDYGVDVKTISDIRNGRSWACVTGFSSQLFCKARPQKLNEADVRDILQRLRLGESQASIARRHNVDPRTIRDIKTGRSWRSVTNLEAA